MDFSWTDEQLTYLKAAVDLGRQLNEGLIERDRAGELSRDGWRVCARFGLQGLPMPEAYGGAAPRS
ncbi:MAG: acyl-CoA dehydrogenase family protein [Anaerolineales bacterium]